ncbi:hypothetical protein [Naasia aerilata]|uniref:Uncharacterized protein n=1 Tax=Naasia aerilata TaxID=1162966 RepID=A0ABN6XL25_9MICO|nr:hypothetical protein [Naasia aerilata]BDZ45561.1 hypothetical protein GCM10025866_14700 [Naasia aerilata]
MQLYSASPLVRSRQVLSDVAAIAAIVLSIVLGAAVGAAVGALAALGRGVEEAGERLQGSMTDAAKALGGLPLVGDAASAPFRDASKVGASLIASGQDQQRLFETLGVVIGLLVALTPIAVVLTVWLRRRLAFVRQARAAAALASTSEGRGLLALRALMTAPPARLLALVPDPAGGWRAGDPAVVSVLTDLELRRTGVLR